MLAPEGPEDDDAVEAVQELRPERLLGALARPSGASKPA